MDGLHDDLTAVLLEGAIEKDIGMLEGVANTLLMYLVLKMSPPEAFLVVLRPKAEEEHRKATHQSWY